MRQQGSRNINLTACLFRNHFKTLLINNLVTRHSLSENCADDKAAVLSAKNFMTQGVRQEEEINMQIPEIDIPEEFFNFIGKCSMGYISSFLAKKTLKDLHSCSICKENLLCIDKSAWDLSDWHVVIAEKEYKSALPYKLKYCTPEVIRGLCTAVE